MTFIREHILDGTPSDVIECYESLGDVAEQSDFGTLDRNVVVVDTETTGFSFHHDELIQIAAARLECGEIADWYVTFVNPGKPIPKEIVHLTGITDQDVANAPTPQKALEGLVAFAEDAIMVAHNVGFDRTFVTRHPEGYPLLENHWVDTLDLSRIALPRLKSHRLIDLVRTFDAPVSTHRADDDVASTCVMYRILLAGIASMPYSLLRAIGKMAPEDQWSTGYAFDILATEIAQGQVAGPMPALKEYLEGEEEAKATADNAGELTSPAVPIDYPNPANKPKPAFSLQTMRRRRVRELPTRKFRKDANDLIGELQFPSAEAIKEAFSPAGLLGSIYPDYEAREEQQIMALAIRNAFEEYENLVVEAGTGVGKSMAYLVVAALFARENDVSVGVATKTNSLLDQLVYSELPALSATLAEFYPDLPLLTWAPLKGMSHYPCLRKIGNMVDAGPLMKDVAGNLVSQAPALAALLSFVNQSEFDDLDGLKIDFRSVPRYLITSTSKECLRKKCPYYGKLCFVHGARRRAESADIIVTNHSLLFCDIATDGGLLPPVRHWVIDEAHATETEARDAFALRFSSETLENLINKVGEGAAKRNIFVRAEGSISSNLEGQLAQFLRLLSSARNKGRKFEHAAREYITQVKSLLFFDPTTQKKKGQSYEKVDIWINEDVRKSEVFADLQTTAVELLKVIDELITVQQDIVGLLEGIDSATVVQREIAACTMDLKSLREAGGVIFEHPSDAYVYQAILNRRKDRFVDTVEALLLDVGEKMNDTLYVRTQSVIYTSATVSVDNTFTSFKNSVGLNYGEFSKATELQLDSNFDFDNNMIIYVVSDMPEPNNPQYQDALNRLLTKIHRANEGSMLTLFTNRREMERSYDVVSEELKNDDLRVVCQKWGVSVKGLRDDFLTDKHLSLFALKSFWEGFDAPGDTLRGVIIPKLPFARPTDPLYCERATRDDHAWWHYVLPQAIIETKQAAGRLIRKANDRGVLILADKRLITKNYGGKFLNSLPSQTVRVATVDEIVEALSIMEL